MNNAQRFEILRIANLQGFGGECGAVAVAINHILFAGRGRYIVALNAAALARKHVVGHVGVEYGKKIWDGAGTYEGVNYRREFLGDWCVVDLPWMRSQRDRERGVLRYMPERVVLRYLPGRCGVTDPMARLRAAAAQIGAR
jgi:hypothetical protein